MWYMCQGTIDQVRYAKKRLKNTAAESVAPETTSALAALVLVLDAVAAALVPVLVWEAEVLELLLEVLVAPGARMVSWAL